MKYALIGRGRMGQVVDRVARARGHECILTVDPAGEPEGESSAGTLSQADLEGVEVAFEFTTPDTAEENVSRLVEAGVPVVCGTTGWSPGSDLDKRCHGARTAVVIAPNFSVGVNLFFLLARDAARRIGTIGGYNDWIIETHHRGKIDAPSGTAARLAAIISEADPRHPKIMAGDPDGGVGEDVLHVASVRAGHEPGHHVAGFDGPDDCIELHHRLRNRDGLARGAVLAAEWIPGRIGRFQFGDVLENLLEEGPLV
jgi:4-hydroxy-tetrahydrodipicolinate reductase